MSKKHFLCLLLCTALLQPAVSFSLFSRGKAVEATPPRTLLDPTAASLSSSRGIPPHQLPQYQAELFTCKGNDGEGPSIIIPRARINDNYCDCSDGSDEPGTSACANGVFTCQNKGFTPLQLTSSRVDDGVCDCCDGSDEDGRQVVCEDSCDAAAAASRQALAASVAAYQAGSAVRSELIRDISARVEAGTSTLTALDANAEKVEGEIARLESVLASEKDLEEGERAAIKSKMLGEYSVALGLQDMQEKTLAALIVNLFSVFGELKLCAW